MFGSNKRKIAGFDKALVDMRKAAATVAVSFAALVPPDRQLTKAELDHVESEFCRDLTERMRAKWTRAGYSNDAIETIHPMILETFRKEFRISLREALPLSKLLPAGEA